MLLDAQHENGYIKGTMNLQFEWDEQKNAANQKNHDVSCEEAKTVFYDDDARLIADPEHSQHEDRFILVGMSYNLRMLTVVHCHRQDEEIIRIISARKATRHEAQAYIRRK